MKYLKTYETLIKKIYKKNDLVKINNYIDSAFLLPFAKILRVDKPNTKKGDYIYRYYVEILFPNKNFWSYFESDEEHTTFVPDFLIVDKVSKKEIDEYLLKMNVNKYNI
jgi:hypothetical protein